MPNSIAFAKTYIPIIDEVCQSASVLRVLASGGRIVRSTRSAREIMIPKISVSGLGGYTRDQGCKTGNINLEHQARSMRAIAVFAFLPARCADGGTSFVG